METLEAVEIGTSPFAGGRFETDEASRDASSLASWTETASSPFGAGFTTGDEGEAERAQWAALVDGLADDSFDEALESLVGEVAGRHLHSMSAWGSHGDGAARASHETADWVGEIAATSDRFLEHLESQYVDRSPESVTQESLAESMSQFAAANPLDSASEQFLGGLVSKALNAAKSVAKAGLSAVGKLLPMGKLFGLLRQLVQPLLKRVLQKAINLLPASARGPATELARRFGVAEASEHDSGLAAEFDAQLAAALVAPNEAAAEEVIAEAEAMSSAPTVDPLTQLDAARARLTRQLAEAEPGRPPTEQLEQFIPAVMAAMPLVRAGLKIVGRERVKTFLATALANLIKGYIGPVAAKSLAPHIVDTGLRLLKLEAESNDLAGAEALVDTLEATVATVAQLPESAIADPLRLESEVAEAFSDAAARLLPHEVLRPDLETFETDEAEGEAAGWVLMPARLGGCRRYRKFGRVFDISISRPQARAIILGEDTLEDRLLETGVERWPVTAEAHLYEAILGTQLGHLAAFEGDGAAAAVGEFEELTPQTAAILAGRPGLGRAVGLAGAPVAPGQRFFRLVVPGRIIRHRPSRIVIRLDTAQPQPTLRVHLRLGERASHLLAGQLSRQALPDALAVIRRVLSPVVRQGLADRLVRHISRASAVAVTAARGTELAAHLVDAMMAAVSQQLPAKAAELEAAAKDPAPGVTLTFGFRFADKPALTNGQPEAPSLTIRAGTHRD